jgi:hypothetical protein
LRFEAQRQVSLDGESQRRDLDRDPDHPRARSGSGD